MGLMNRREFVRRAGAGGLCALLGLFLCVTIGEVEGDCSGGFRAVELHVFLVWAPAK